MINGEKSRFLVDSGSDVTVLPLDRFLAIPAKSRPTLTPLGVPLYGATGHSLDVRGTCTIPLGIGDHVVPVECTVVGGRVCPILGMNFMKQHKVALDFGSGEMRFGNTTLCLSGLKPPAAFTVEVAETLVVPARQEVVAIVRPRGRRQAKYIKPGLFTGIISALGSFADDTGLVMGRTLVKSNRKAMPVLMVNPNSYPVRMRRGSVIGSFQPVDCVTGRDLDHPNTGSVAGSDSSARTEVRRPGRSLKVGAIGSSSPSRTTVTNTQPRPSLAPEVETLLRGTELTAAQTSEVRELLANYEDVFSLPGSRLGRSSKVQHRIDTGTHPPIRQKARRIPTAQHPMYREEMAKMKELDIIEPSDSPWASPTVLVRKKDGTMRFCVDYRRLNDVTIKDSYPLPNIEDTFDSLSGATYFCALDLASGYWQVDVHPDDRPKTAFLTREGLWQFKVMPFGLCNAPATFERLMEMVLRGLLWERCLVYIDDIVVYGRTFQETLQNLEAVLKRVKDAGLKLKPKKCELFTKEILYLGFRVSGEGVKPDPGKIEAVTKWPRPYSVTDVRAFLGFANYHRRFIQDFAQIAKPLQLLTNKGQPFVWGESQQVAFESLKSLLTTCPMLHHPVPDVPFILDTDASAFALGGVLSQRVDEEERVVAFASKSLSKTEMNYCTTHRELLAVIRMTDKFRHYLWGRRFRLRTDHASLKWLLNYKDADGMLARWLAKLQAYDFSIEHRPGLQHGNADGLSRCGKCKNPDCAGLIGPGEATRTSSDSEFDVAAVKNRPGQKSFASRTGGVGNPRVVRQKVRRKCDPKGALRPRGHSPCRHPDKSHGTAGAPLPMLLTKRHLSVGRLARVRKLDKLLSRCWLAGFSPEDLEAAQKADPDVSPVLGWAKDGKRPAKTELAPCSAETKNIVTQWSLLRERNGTLYREAKRRQTGQTFYQFVVPLGLRSKILEQLHNLRIVGHLGIARTLARVQERYYWPNVAIDVARWCASCSECAARKGKPPPKRVPLAPLPVGEPFERIALDILDTHIPTKRGHVYILVISDYFSKYTDAFPLRRKTTYNCAKVLAERWVAYHGVPTVIHSDQGREFEGGVFQRLAELLGANKTRTAPYRPQSDGLVERFNRTLLNMLSVFACDRPTTWDDHLPYLLSAYRSSVHASTQCTPNSLTYGRETNLPIDLMIPGSPQSDIKAQNYPDYVQFVRKALQTAHSFARRHMGQALVRQKRGYDVHAKNRSSFNTGDLVRYYYVPIKNRDKFACPWVGPYKVLERVTEVDYRIQRLERTRDTRVVHIDHLKPFEKDYEPSMDNEGLPPLILDRDYLDEEATVAHDEYLAILEPLLDRESPVPTTTDSEPVAVGAPRGSHAKTRRSSRTTRAPQRYGYSNHSVHRRPGHWS